jgi:hypothetical protein
LRWLLRDEGVAWILEKVDEKVEAITYDGRKGMGGDECEAVTQAKMMLFRPLEKSPVSSVDSDRSSGGETGGSWTERPVARRSRRALYLLILGTGRESAR